VRALALRDLTQVRWGNAVTNSAIRGRGLRQGCPLSPWLFTLVLHAAIEGVIQHLPRYSVDNHGDNMLPALLAYADDLLALASELQDVVDLLEALVPRLQELGLEVNYTKTEYMLRSPWERHHGPPRPVQLGRYEVNQVARLVYLGAHISDGLDRKATVRHRSQRAQRNLAALMPTLQEHPLPPRVLHQLYRTNVTAALAYELATAASTKGQRGSVRRQADVMRNAMLATARRPGQAPCLRGEVARHSIIRSVRQARIKFAGHVHRRPMGHMLRRARALDIGVKKQGRPCFTYNTTLQEEMAELTAPEQGWEQLWASRAETDRYVKRDDIGYVSSEDEWQDHALAVVQPGAEESEED